MLLNVDHVSSIQDFFLGSSARAGRASPPSRRFAGCPSAVELSLIGDRVRLEPLDSGVGVAWVDTPVEPSSDAVGLILPAGSNVHVGAVVSRTGEVDRFVVDDGIVFFESMPSSQLIDDLCRRRLGRATPSPTIGTDWYWLQRWLINVSASTWSCSDVRSEVMLDVVSVAGLHPAVDVEELVGLDRIGITSFVVERHREHAIAADWSCVRLDALLDERHDGHDWARQLDDGAFSRWINAAGIPLSAVAEELITGCSPFALELIGAVIADVAARQSVM